MGLLILLALTTTGCATNHYVAAKLPSEWHAELTKNAQTLELSRIASPTMQSDVIGRGDVIEIHISAGLSSEDDITRVARVSEMGTIFLSHLGNVPLEGLELEAAEATIGSLCMEKGLYLSPQVTVTMEQPKENTIHVIGAVNEPMTYRLRSGSSSLLDAIIAAGGLSEDAGTTVEIRHQGYRNDPAAPAIAGLQDSMSPDGVVPAGYEEKVEPSGARTVRVDLISATKQGSGGQYLPDGSIVTVERRDPEAIHVLGLVHKPDEYEFPVGKEVKLLDAIAKAGGISNPIANKVYIVRKKADSEETALIEASIRRAKNKRGSDNPRLAPGDVVSVEQTPLTAAFEALRLIGFGVSGRAF